MSAACEGEQLVHGTANVEEGIRHLGSKFMMGD